MATSRPSAALLSGQGYYEDFHVGQRIRHARGATVGEVENNLLTKMAVNTADAHWNDDRLPPGHALGEGRLVFGLVTASLVFGLASQDTAEQAVAEVSCTGLRFKAPVHIGDTIYSFTEVASIDEAESADAGAVVFHHWGANQDGTVVFEGTRRVLLKRRRPSTTT